MNLRSRLTNLSMALSKDRGTGQTTMAAKVAKEMGAVMLAYNFRDATRIERKYGVPTKSVDMNLEGINGPFIMDHYAISSLLLRAAEKIEFLEKQNAHMKESIKEMEEVIDSALTALGANPK